MAFSVIVKSLLFEPGILFLLRALHITLVTPHLLVRDCLALLLDLGHVDHVAEQLGEVLALLLAEGETLLLKHELALVAGHSLRPAHSAITSFSIHVTTHCVVQTDSCSVSQAVVISSLQTSICSVLQTSSYVTS